jgi:hypothetical protein
MTLARLTSALNTVRRLFRVVSASGDLPDRMADTAAQLRSPNVTSTFGITAEM